MEMRRPSGFRQRKSSSNVTREDLGIEGSGVERKVDGSTVKHRSRLSGLRLVERRSTPLRHESTSLWTKLTQLVLFAVQRL